MQSHRHHRKLRSQGGDDSGENIIELGLETHGLVHANPAIAYEHGLLVHSYDDPATVPVDVDGFLAAVGHAPVGTGTGSSEKPNVEKECPRCRGAGKVVESRKIPNGPQAAERKKVVFGVRVPKDEREDGHEVLESLVDATIDLLADARIIRDRNKGASYYALVYALAFFQQNFKPEVEA